MRKRFRAHCLQPIALFLICALALPNPLTVRAEPGRSTLRPRAGGLEEPTPVTAGLEQALDHRPAAGMEESWLRRVLNRVVLGPSQRFGYRSSMRYRAREEERFLKQAWNESPKPPVPDSLQGFVLGHFSAFLEGLIENGIVRDIRVDGQSALMEFGTRGTLEEIQSMLQGRPVFSVKIEGGALEITTDPRMVEQEITSATRFEVGGLLYRLKDSGSPRTAYVISEVKGQVVQAHEMFPAVGFPEDGLETIKVVRKDLEGNDAWRYVPAKDFSRSLQEASQEALREGEEALKQIRNESSVRRPLLSKSGDVFEGVLRDVNAILVRNIQRGFIQQIMTDDVAIRQAMDSHAGMMDKYIELARNLEGRKARFERLGERGEILRVTQIQSGAEGTSVHPAAGMEEKESVVARFRSAVGETLPLLLRTGGGVEPLHRDFPGQPVVKLAGPRGELWVVSTAPMDSAQLLGLKVPVFIQPEYEARIRRQLQPGTDPKSGWIRMAKTVLEKGAIVIGDKDYRKKLGEKPFVLGQIFLEVDQTTVSQVTLGLLARVLTNMNTVPGEVLEVQSGFESGADAEESALVSA